MAAENNGKNIPSDKAKSVKEIVNGLIESAAETFAQADKACGIICEAARGEYEAKKAELAAVKDSLDACLAGVKNQKVANAIDYSIRNKDMCHMSAVSTVDFAAMEYFIDRLNSMKFPARAIRKNTYCGTSVTGYIAGCYSAIARKIENTRKAAEEKMRNACDGAEKKAAANIADGWNRLCSEIEKCAARERDEAVAAVKKDLRIDI